MVRGQGAPGSRVVLMNLFILSSENTLTRLWKISCLEGNMWSRGNTDLAHLNR